MALPLKSWFTVFNAIDVTTTARVPFLGSEHPEHANSIMLEIVAATSPSWTLDIQGRTHPDGTYVAVDYIQIWQAGIAAFANSQLSITDTTRRFYLIPNCPSFLQLIGTRTAGTLTIRGCYTSEVFPQWLVTGARGELRVGGDVANAGADAGFPLKVGGVARTALPTAVAAAQRVNAMFDVYGRIVTVPYRPGASEVLSAWARIAATSVDRATIVTPTSGKAARIIAVSVMADGLTTATTVQVWFGTGTALNTTADKAIAQLDVPTRGASDRGFPDGGGKIGAVDDVVSWNTTVETEGNTGAPILSIVVWYREE